MEGLRIHLFVLDIPRLTDLLLKLIFALDLEIGEFVLLQAVGGLFVMAPVECHLFRRIRVVIRKTVSNIQDSYVTGLVQIEFHPFQGLVELVIAILDLCFRVLFLFLLLFDLVEDSLDGWCTSTREFFGQVY